MQRRKYIMEAPFHNKCKIDGGSETFGRHKSHFITCNTPKNAEALAKTMQKELPMCIQIDWIDEYVRVRVDERCAEMQGMDFGEFDLALWGSLNTYINPNFYGLVLPRSG